MALHVFVFLLVVCLLLALALLWRLDWFPLRPSSSRGGVKRTTLHRLLQPRSPDDCPACRLSYTLSSRVEPAPAPVRPWREVKSRRRAPKRVNTQGFACPNLQCSYFGITDAHIHALVGDGKHGRAEQSQTFRCHACRTTFTSRRNTPLYRLKTPLSRSPWCSLRWPKGWTLPLPNGSLATDKPPSRAFLTRAGEHAQTLHERFFCHLHLPHLQLDELRTRLRSSTQLLWLWLAIDPCTKLLPVLYLGPRTQNAAHRVIRVSR